VNRKTDPTTLERSTERPESKKEEKAYDFLPGTKEEKRLNREAHTLLMAVLPFPPRDN
jgi:hypothetical protein